ncbi:MAG: RHS repeat domain-containing protein [Flavobacteriales bacterium]
MQGESVNNRIPTENENAELYQYYYHPDHLGSSSYITNLDGEVVQHIEYVPFGEVFIEERNNTWNTPYLFNGKELDEETGLYYYGARYYNPRISLWLSVDPLATYNPVMEVEHYIDGQHNGGVFNSFNLNVYGYCYQNPILYFDPNGKQSKFWTRFWGGLQMVGGAVEVVGGAVGMVAPEPATTIGVALLVANGADNVQAGARQLWTGESTDTLLHTGVEAGAEALGADSDTANKIATGVDIATIFIGGFGSLKGNIQNIF